MIQFMKQFVWPIFLFVVFISLCGIAVFKIAGLKRQDKLLPFDLLRFGCSREDDRVLAGYREHPSSTFSFNCKEIHDRTDGIRCQRGYT